MSQNIVDTAAGKRLAIETDNGNILVPLPPADTQPLAEATGPKIDRTADAYEYANREGGGRTIVRGQP